MNNTNIENKITSGFSFLFLFLLIFDLKIVGSFGSAIITLFFCFLLILINFSKYSKNFGYVYDKYHVFMFMYLVLLLYVFGRFLFSDLGEISYLLTTLKTTMVLLATISYLVVFYSKDLSKILFNVFFLNACICLFFGTFPQFKFLIYPFHYGPNLPDMLIGQNEYRNAFLAGAGYFGIAALYGLVFSYLLKLCVDSKNIFDYSKLVVIAVAGILAGRIALICYLVSILYFLIIKKKFNVLFFSVVSFSLFIFALNYIPSLEFAKIWFYEMFVDNDIGESESLMQFFDSLYFPSHEVTLLFGDAKYGNALSYYGGSDSGYIRNIMFGGLIYLLILIICFISIFDKLYKNTFIYVLLVVSFILHIKGVFIFNNPGFFGIILSICLILYRNTIVHQ